MLFHELKRDIYRVHQQKPDAQNFTSKKIQKTGLKIENNSF